MSDYRSGFVALVGRPNVGKSTLLNKIIGQKISITSDKPQTTRDQLRGILSGPNYQIIWVDTPGLHKPLHHLGEQMVKTAQKTLLNVDLILWVLDAETGFKPADHKVAQILSAIEQRIFAVWNKIDLCDSVQEFQFGEANPRVLKTFEVSAKSGAGVPELIREVAAQLPPGPAFYPPEMITDHPEQFIIAEYIREKVLDQTEDEIPHSIAVRIEDYKTRPNGQVFIEATIYVERDSQKGIIIGAKGKRLKTVGSAARVEIEKLLDAPVYLNLWVKVRKNWRNSNKILRELGYGGEESD